MPRSALSVCLRHPAHRNPFHVRTDCDAVGHLPWWEIGACLGINGIVGESENDCQLIGLLYKTEELMGRLVLEKHLIEFGPKPGGLALQFIYCLGCVRMNQASLYLRVLTAPCGEGRGLLADPADRLEQDLPVWKRLQPPSATGEMLPATAPAGPSA